jgi:hypothetical protein
LKRSGVSLPILLLGLSPRAQTDRTGRRKLSTVEVSRGDKSWEPRLRPNSTRIRVLRQAFQKDPIIHDSQLQGTVPPLCLSSHSRKTTLSLTDRHIFLTIAIARVSCETRQMACFPLWITPLAQPKSSTPRISSPVSSQSLHGLRCSASMPRRLVLEAQVSLPHTTGSSSRVIGWE